MNSTLCLNTPTRPNQKHKCRALMPIHCAWATNVYTVSVALPVSMRPRRKIAKVKDAAPSPLYTRISSKWMPLSRRSENCINWSRQMCEIILYIKGEQNMYGSTWACLQQWSVCIRLIHGNLFFIVDPTVIGTRKHNPTHFYYWIGWRNHLCSLNSASHCTLGRSIENRSVIYV